MSVLRNLESKLADLVEGTFGRVFRSEVRPVELARKLAKEMDQDRTVRQSAGGTVQQADHGHTMVYSTSDRVSEQLAESRVARTGRGVVVFDGKRFIVGAQGATLGRSRECDVVVDDANVSRRHAEIRPGPQGWTIADLGSTNGTRVNGRAVTGGAQPLEPGDRLELGTAVATFETE